MLTDYYVIDTNFRKQTYPEYYTTLNQLADALENHEAYNDGRPDFVPGSDRLRQHVAAMKEVGVGADRGDSLLKEKRQALREESEIDVDACVSYLRILAMGKRDPTMLHTFSLPIKGNQPKSVRKAGSPQQIEIRIAVKHMKKVSGGIVIEGKHIRNGGPYLLQLCKGEPTSEESWFNPGGHYQSCKKIELRDLEPANRYYIRLRTDGPGGPGPWSQPVSIIVL
ncbi:hypothetical protein GMSM_09990 [Geomonas sp. Red276]